MIINKDVMRDYNERSVLQTIVNYGPISRNEISKKLGLNKVSVSDIVGSFIDRKLVYSLGEAKSSNASGRKPELIEYNSAYGYVISFSLNGKIRWKYLQQSSMGVRWITTSRTLIVSQFLKLLVRWKKWSVSYRILIQSLVFKLFPLLFLGWSTRVKS